MGVTTGDKGDDAADIERTVAEIKTASASARPCGVSFSCDPCTCSRSCATQPFRPEPTPRQRPGRPGEAGAALGVRL